MWYNYKMKKRGFTLIEHERSKISMSNSCSFRRAHYIRSSVRRNESFTLIELLVVLAIMGMIVSIILVSLGPQREKGKDAMRQADIRGIMNAMEMCLSDDGQYPNITVDASSIVTNTSIVSGVKTYLSPFPKDPNGANYYGKVNAVTPPATRQQYCIYAVLVSPATYFCASEKGIKSSTTVPSLGACCF